MTTMLRDMWNDFVFSKISALTESAGHFISTGGQTGQIGLFYSSRVGELPGFSHEKHGYVAVKPLFWAGEDDGFDTFSPRVLFGDSPIASSPNTTRKLQSLHVLWSTWASDDNLGHVLWEEMASIWYAMIRMNVLIMNVTAMHWPDNLPDRPLAKKFRDAFFPAISSKPPVSFYPYIDSIAGPVEDGLRNVCFDQFLVGGNVRRFVRRMSWHNYGHEHLFFSLRSRILESHELDPYFVPAAHRIVISHKTSSNYHSDSRYKTHRSIYNIEEVTHFVRSRYGQIEVDVVDLKEYPVADQLRLLLSTTVFITPAGGVSMVLPFLPDGAHVIILDYLEREDDEMVGTKAGESVSMEAPFWNYWPHVKKLYYQVRTNESLKSDDPVKSLDEVSWRDEVSIQVDLSRLETLLEMAFEHMSAL